MSKKIVINPFTRISGMLEISVETDGERVCSAYSSGLMFRGFELMLKGRNPLDVNYFTERICGICSTAHSMASAIALEDSLGIEISEGAKLLRNIIHGCEFLQNHIRHFYLYSTPDYVKGPDLNPIKPIKDCEYKLPEGENSRIAENYFKAIEFSRMAHEMLAIFGGKAPHNHGIVAGGVSVEVTSDKIIKFKSILQEVKYFVDNSMVPDVYSIAQYYYDCFNTGKGPGNFLSYGVFDNGEDPDS
ncbi:MAG: nickel-dependent hydrogenase large subunit, partial [Candidatus Afipia apatlaquensis]|nr:nickel-dependent hydrogenase large subunit [Candidatus Afipia apatlaquensis]